MRRPPANAKRDLNEAEIFAVLRANGITVVPMDTPCDALCGYKGRTYAVEVKNGHNATLTPAQKAFRARWAGCYTVLHSVAEAKLWARCVRGVGRASFEQFENTVEVVGVVR